MFRLPPISTLFPYTTLFRSCRVYGFFSRLFGQCASIRLPMPLIRVTRRQAFRNLSAIRDDHCLGDDRSEEHTSELQSHSDLVCRLLLEKKKKRMKNEKYSSH